MRCGSRSKWLRAKDTFFWAMKLSCEGKAEPLLSTLFHGSGFMSMIDFLIEGMLRSA